MDCPKCASPDAQKLLTSLLCLNRNCADYDLNYHTDYLKQGVCDELKKSSQRTLSRIVIKDVKVSIVGQVANVTIPFLL